jgi:hypothetical protein
MAKKVKKGQFIPLNSPTHNDSGLIQITYIKNSKKAWPNLDMIIWDCDRKVSLDFSFDTKKEGKARLEKVKNMKQAINQMEKYIVSHLKDLE